MGESSLVSIIVPAYEGNYTKGRCGYSIEAITIHHMSEIWSAKYCGESFQDVNRKASAHYGIGPFGTIVQYVSEIDTAWTNSNWESNCKSVTIEIANCEIGGMWQVTDLSLDSLIKLVADIANRNNLGMLVKGVNLTWHSMFKDKNCPGPYLLSKLDYIIDEANKINGYVDNDDNCKRKVLVNN